jgi:hypothetical protein
MNAWLSGTSLIARLLILTHWFNPFARRSLCKLEVGGEWPCDQQASKRAGALPVRVPLHPPRLRRYANGLGARC